MMKELNKEQLDDLREILFHCRHSRIDLTRRLNKGEYNDEDEDELLKECNYISEAIEAIENIEDIDDYNDFFEKFPDLY